ncbi:MAG: hypothetical protein HC836_22790 [Richelia sp. RM2_1_2]|nr:hypothetical protein [Richelia sp. RM2_1_2]
MITSRDPGTFILGDSGGYQFGTGAVSYPWGDKAAQKEVQLATMHWLENTCDAAMTLDLPPWIATRNKEAIKAGLASYEDCRNATLDSLTTFIENRTPGKVKFLNVLQGETEENIEDWYNHVIKFSMKEYYDNPFEGFAFAGRQSYCMYTILKTMLKLLDTDLLNHGPILHFLGSGKLNSATAFSRLQHELQKRTGSNLQITFDAASPYLSAASGKVYSGISISKEEVTFKYNSLPATVKMLVDIAGGSKEIPAIELVEGILHTGEFFTGERANDPVWLRKNGGRSAGAIDIFHQPLLWTNSPIVKHIKNKHIYNIKTIDIIEEKITTNEKGKKVKVKEATGERRDLVQIDSLAYAVAMAHNVYMHIQGICRMNELYNNNEFKKLPAKYGKMDNLLKKVFALPKAKALQMLEEEKQFLLEFTGKGRKQKALITTEHSSKHLFD